MKFFHLGLLAVIYASSAFSKVTTSEVDGAKIIQISLEGIETKEISVVDTPFQEVKLRGADELAGVLYKVGTPEIPVLRLYTDSIPTIEFGAMVEGILTQNIPIKPAQLPVIKMPNALKILSFDNAAYESHEYTPVLPYTVEEAGSVKGKVQYLVTIYPFSLQPSTGAWKLIRDIKIMTKIEVKSESDSKPEIFAIVVGEKFVKNEALAKYEEFKSALGYKVERIVVKPKTNPDDIRSELQALLQRSDANLTQALIIGDHADVPGKEAEFITGVTDHYYRAIDTDNYLTDINGPDIGVGRVSVQNDTQLTHVLEKFKRYEEANFSSENWLEHASFIATNDQYQVAEATHNYVIDQYTKKQGVKGNFPEPSAKGGDKLYAITYRASNPHVMTALKAGRTIIDYSGHGSYTSWAGPNVSQNDVRSLTDRNYLPFVISNACITGDFRINESFGETWQRHPAGAITFWGSMDSTFWDEDDILERALFTGIYQKGLSSFGDMTSDALREFWRYYGGDGSSSYYWETYVTFGDPSIALRTSPTQALTVEGPEKVPVGAQDVTYIVKRGGAPAEGVRIALVNTTGDWQKVAVTDKEGQASFTLDHVARSPQKMKFTVSSQNARLSRGSLAIGD